MAQLFTMKFDDLHLILEATCGRRELTPEILPLASMPVLWPIWQGSVQLSLTEEELPTKIAGADGYPHVKKETQVLTYSVIADICVGSYT